MTRQVWTNNYCCSACCAVTPRACVVGESSPTTNENTLLHRQSMCTCIRLLPVGSDPTQPVNPSIADKKRTARTEVFQRVAVSVANPRCRRRQSCAQNKARAQGSPGVVRRECKVLFIAGTSNFNVTQDLLSEMKQVSVNPSQPD